jgi:phosphatidylinositol alpha-1,6-mannosyltransferase
MAVPCLYLSLLHRIPYFVAIHGLDALEGRFKNRLLQRFTLWRASGVLPVSHYTKDLLEMPKLKRTGRVQVLANGVDTDRFRKRPRNAAIETKYGIGPGIRILNIGRLIERKGFDMTIRALALIDDPAVNFYIGGTGPYEAALRALAINVGVADRVHFLGFVDETDLIDVYNSADIFCMPSRELPYQVEGFGITYLEAAACGVPSIGGLRSGAQDAIVDGKTGLLVDPESPESIAGAIRRLTTDKSLREILGAAALERVRQELTWKAAVDRLLGIIQQA